MWQPHSLTSRADMDYVMPKAKLVDVRKLSLNVLNATTHNSRVLSLWKHIFNE